MAISQFYCGRLVLNFPPLADWPSYTDLIQVDRCRMLDGCGCISQGPKLLGEAVAQRNRYMEYLHRNLASEFWGGAPKQENGMQSLLRGIQNIVDQVRFDGVAILDVGSALYEGPDRCHAADLAVLLACSVPIHALEPLESELRRTRRAAEQQLRRELRLGRRKTAECIRWHQLAASNVTGMLPMRGKANQASMSMAIPKITRSPDYTNIPVRRVAAKRLDEFAEDLALGPLLLLKIDTEGHDMVVLQGARSLLERGCIAAVVFEVAGQMNADFFRIHKEFGQPRPDLVAQLGPKIAEPNLESMVHWLQSLQYESFLLGSTSLIPLTSSWWHSSYELCVARAELPCWYDVLALLQPKPRGTCFGKSLTAVRRLVFGAFQRPRLWASYRKKFMPTPGDPVQRSLRRIEVCIFQLQDIRLINDHHGRVGLWRIRRMWKKELSCHVSAVDCHVAYCICMYLLRSLRAADEALRKGDYVKLNVCELPVGQYAQRLEGGKWMEVDAIAWCSS